MVLLVIGLVAVIIAVVVGIILTRRRSDDDDEPGGRQNVRDRLGSRGRDGRLRTDPRMARKPAPRGPAPSRRPAGEPRGYGGPDRGYEPAGFDQSRGYEPSPRGYGESAPAAGDDQRTERIPAARRSGRYQDTPEPATPVGARASRAATAPRRGAEEQIPGPDALYDTGPSAADLTATTISADPDLADSDVFPRVRAEIPETEAKRPKNQPKGRGRASRGRHDDDDDDWPSTEWTSSPTSSTGRNCPPQAARDHGPRCPAQRSRPGQPKPSRTTTPPAASGRAASRPQPAPDARARGPGPPPPACRPSRADGQPPGHAPADGWRGHRPWAPAVLAERPAAAASTERLPPAAGPPAQTAPPAPPARHRTCPQPPSLRRPGSMTTR